MDLVVNRAAARQKLQRNGIAVALVVHRELVAEPLLLPGTRTVTTNRPRKSGFLEFGDSPNHGASPGFPDEIDGALSDDSCEAVDRDSNIPGEVEERNGSHHHHRICAVVNLYALDK